MLEYFIQLIDKVIHVSAESCLQVRGRFIPSWRYRIACCHGSESHIAGHGSLNWRFYLWALFGRKLRRLCMWKSLADLPALYEHRSTSGCNPCSQPSGTDKHWQTCYNKYRNETDPRHFTSRYWFPPLLFRTPFAIMAPFCLLLGMTWLLLTPAVSANPLPLRENVPQGQLLHLAPMANALKVPGESPAYYCADPRNDIFQIRRLDFIPTNVRMYVLYLLSTLGLRCHQH